MDSKARDIRDKKPTEASQEQAEGYHNITTLLSIASQISGQINAILDPDALLSSVIPLLKEGFDLYYVHVYLLDEDSGLLRLKAGYGEAGRLMLEKGHSIPLAQEQSLNAQAARTREAVVVNDVRANPAWLPNPLLPDTRSEAALPMVIGDTVLGVFDVQHDKKDYFTQDYVDVFFSLAGQIATALQNARYVEQIAVNLQQTQTRLEIGQAFASTETLRDVATVFVESVRVAAHFEVIFASLDADAEEPTFSINHIAGPGGDARRDFAGYAVGHSYRAVDYLFYPLVSEHDPFICNNIADDNRMGENLKSLLTKAGVASLVVYPLFSHHEWLGILTGFSAEQNAFGANELYRYETVVDLGEAALLQARLRDLLQLTQFSVDHAPAAILWITPDARIFSVNDTACAMLGYSRKELLEMADIAKLDPNMIRSVWNVHWQNVKRDQSFVIESEYRHHAGYLIPVEVTATYLHYAGQEYNCVFVRDITERQNAELARERFATQLHTAAEIASQVGAIHDPDALLKAVIPLLKDRFELYHAHVYVATETDLILRSGYGRIGQIMVNQGHRIPRDHPRSLVARAARKREAVMVNDVTEAPDHLPNLLLPKTLSEVAVPIIYGDKVLGVFDVQADRKDYFTSSDVDVFVTLAGQLANSLYTAQLFEVQRSIERELRSSAETVRAIFNAMTEGIVVTNMMGGIIDANDAAAHMHGYANREALSGRSFLELVSKGSWSQISENIRHALDTGSGNVLECQMLRQDGGVFEAEQSVALFQDSEGNPMGVVSIIRNISERKQAQRAIAQFRALAENAVDGIFMADLSGRISYANKACYEMFGYALASQDMLGRALTEFWTQDDVETLITQALPSAGAGGWQGEAHQVRKDGSTFDASLTLFAVTSESGQAIRVATIIRDITRRKRDEAELARFALQLRTAAQVAAQVTSILDPTALLESIVPLLQKQFDLYHVHVYTLDEAKTDLIMRVGSGEAGRILRERRHHIALDREKSLVATSARKREVIVVNDVTLEPSHLPNPLLPNTRSEVSVPLVVGDEVVGVLDVQDDEVNRFGQTEVDVFTTLAAQIAIALRNAGFFSELNAVAERLREIDQLKSEFLANMSHELRTPLNSILGYAEVLLMGIDGELNVDMLEDVSAIFENGQQLLNLINDILDLTKIEAGRMTLNKVRVPLKPMLEEVRNHHLVLLQKDEKPVEVNIAIEDNLPSLYADKLRIAQVLNNLVSNAVKFTDKGNILLDAAYDEETGMVRISVKDTGVGISAEDIKLLFERFRQVDGSTTRRQQGTGLGLAITKHLVEMHEGTITVKSEPNKGSTFTVCLPAVAMEE